MIQIGCSQTVVAAIIFQQTLQFYIVISRDAFILF